MDIDIHNYKRRFEKSLERIKNSEDISTGNKEVMYKFRDYCICQGISYGKRKKK